MFVDHCKIDFHYHSDKKFSISEIVSSCFNYPSRFLLLRARVERNQFFIPKFYFDVVLLSSPSFRNINKIGIYSSRSSQIWLLSMLNILFAFLPLCFQIMMDEVFMAWQSLLHSVSRGWRHLRGNFLSKQDWYCYYSPRLSGVPVHASVLFQQDKHAQILEIEVEQCRLLQSENAQSNSEDGESPVYIIIF